MAAVLPEDLASSRHYDDLAAAIPDERFVFMNHGYLERGEDLGWVEPDDRVFAYSANLVRHLVRDAPVAGGRVLDVGCGRGGTASYLVRYAGAASVVGLDRSGRNVEFCTRVHRRAETRFVQGDAQCLPFADATFDVVTNIESSHCYPRIDAFFAEVFRVLRPGGTFCYTDNLFAGVASNPERLAQLRAAGLQVVDVADVTTSVANGVFAASERLLRFFVDTIDADRRNADRVVRLVHAITIKPFALYASRRVSYWRWRARRPG